MQLRCDLHNHSCLSPCGSLDLSPSALARLARQRGLHAIALTDHHTAQNAPAFAEACRRENLLPVFGLEISTVEEIHCLALFGAPADALAFERLLRPHLPDFPNIPEKLGDQPVVDIDDNILDLVPHYLGTASDIPFSALRPFVERAGGLFVPAHVDRPAFSLLSQLGRLPADAAPVVEISPHARPGLVERLRRDYTLLASSDAHHPDQVATAWTEIDIGSAPPTWPAIRAAILAGRTLPSHA